MPCNITVNIILSLPPNVQTVHLAFELYPHVQNINFIIIPYIIELCTDARHLTTKSLIKFWIQLIVENNNSAKNQRMFTYLEGVFSLASCCLIFVH
jgi:hypothetical protein